MQKVIDNYDVDRVHYGLITFGSSATIRIRFTDQVKDPDEIKKSFSENMLSTRSSPNLDEALAKAEILFQDSKRDQTQKILVLIMDRLSPSDPVIVQVHGTWLYLFAVEVLFALVLQTDICSKLAVHKCFQFNCAEIVIYS